MKLFPTFFKFFDSVNIKYFQLKQLIKYFYWVFSISFTDKVYLFFPLWDKKKSNTLLTIYRAVIFTFLLLLVLLLKIKWQAIGKNAKIYVLWAVSR
jgi:hypothetical protein